MEFTSIQPQALQAVISRGQPVALIDVRTPAEFAEVHADAARNIPLDRLDAKQLHSAAGSPLYFICKSGARGRQACEKILAAGLENAVNVEGGTEAWAQAGLPVVRGRKTMSLERQVRIAAGSLTLAGAVLAWFVNPCFVGLSAFVGAGLIFAGITDTCGMALILARMPWNQRA
jgi:rhodanese-related sulfurtransferase